MSPEEPTPRQTGETLEHPVEAPTLDAASLPAPGRRIGVYLIERELGAGAMGVVYVAFDTKLERRVALKLLKHQSDPKARRRFLREARALARIAHPNVVQIHDIDEIDGLAFITMELVRGVTLERWLGARSRARAEIIEVLQAAGRGLAAAHARGLVHRDFKPGNVMVDEGGRVLVMDFGLAREWARDDSSTAALRGGARLESTSTKTSVVGTPEYMAPEQLDGLEATAQADQFSFCVTTWEALHGRRPFEADTVLDLLVAIKRGDCSTPARDDVPDRLRAVLLRGMAFEPGARWPAMETLLDALGLASEPRPEGPRARRVSWRWFLVGVAVASVLGLLVWWLTRG